MMARRSYLLKVSEPYVMVPARVAALIEARTNIASARVQLRGLDPEATAVLEDIRYAAMAWRGSDIGTEDDREPEPATRSEWLSTSQAADLLGITGRAVLKAVHEGRLPATEVGKRWQINREDVQHYKAIRVA